MPSIDKLKAEDDIWSKTKSDWPAITATMKPWAYNWWLGSAVDRPNLGRELARYQAAGLGGIHIIPIYGAKSAEDGNSLSRPQVDGDARFYSNGGKKTGHGRRYDPRHGLVLRRPQRPAGQACMRPETKVIAVPEARVLRANFRRDALQALVAYGPNGKTADLWDRIDHRAR